jgi:hypothetical protein
MAIRYLSGINVDSNTLFVNDANNLVGIGTVSPAGSLHIQKNSGNYSNEAIKITGTPLSNVTDGTSATEGYGLYLSYNVSGNRQFVFADTVSGYGVRYIGTSLDGFNKITQSREDLNLGTETNGVHVAAGISNTQFSVSNVGGTASKIVTEIKGAASQTGNYLNISSSSGVGDIVSVLSSGNVGIGTTSPGYKLDVAGSINTNDVYRIGGNTILSGTTSVAVGSSGGTGSVALRTTSGDGLVLSGSSVGIGTTSPTSKLEVFDGDISVTTSGSFSFLNLNRNFIPNSSGVLLGGIKYRGYSTGTTYQSGAYIYSYSSAAWTSTSSPGYLSIQTTPSGSTTPVERMLVASNGALKLNAYGSGSNTGTATQRLAVDASGNVIEIPIGSGPVDGNGTANYVTKWSDTDTITNSIIYDNGSAVGIGTTTPEKKLDVNGSLVVGMSPPAPFWNAKFKDYSDGSAIYISSVNGGGGKYIAGNAYYYNSLQWWSDKTTASAINLDNGAVVFYTNSGLTPNTDFIPSERMRITSAGRVGIGTTSPSELFAVAGNIELTLGVDRYIYIGSATNYYYRLQSVGDDFQIQEVTTPRLTIKYPNGNVGIGTTAPGYRLHVKDSTNIGTIAIGNDTYPGLIYSNAGTGEFRIDNRSSAAGGYITFYPNGQAATIGSEAMRITTAGNVGIGTTSPTYKLDVNVASNSDALRVQQAGASRFILNGDGVMTWGAGAASGYLSWDTNLAIVGGQTNNSLALYAGAGEKVRITTGGNVGIGTTSPATKVTVGPYEGSRLPYINGTATTFNADGITVTSYNTGNAGVGGGLDLTNNVYSIGSFSPVISFSSKTQSGTYNNNYAAIYGVLAGDSGDGNWNSGHLVFATALAYGASEKMRITNAGNVGIGTTSPSNKFVSVNDATFNGENSYSIAAAASSDSGYKTVIGYDYANDIGVISAVRQGIQWKNLSILPVGNTNLGVGTITPSQRLHVSGNIRVTGAYYDSNNSAGSSGQVLSSTGSGTDWVSLSEITGVDGTGTANYVAKWSDTDTITNSQIVDNGTNVGINNASPKTRLDVNGAIGFGSKSMSMTDTFATALTVNMNDHNGCYVKITAFGDWANHSTIAYLGEFFLQASAGAYNEPGIIIRQVDNTGGGDDIQAQIVDPAGTGTRDFVIQLKSTSSANTPFTAVLQYEVRGMYNSVS